MLSLFSKIFGRSPRQGPLLEEKSNTSMPTVQGSQPWLKPFVIASLSAPATTPSLNANYLQVVSTVSRRNELTVYDGQFTMAAVLTSVAATELDADEDDSGVTTRNLLGHVLAPVQLKVIPDTNSCPPTVLLLIQSVRVFPDRTYQRPPGRIPHVYADADVCDALLAVSSRKLAPFRSAADLKKSDTRHSEGSSLSHALSSFETYRQEVGLPPFSLGDDDSDFESVMRVLDDPDAARANYLDQTEVNPNTHNTPVNDEGSREPGEEPRKRKENEPSGPDWEIQFTQGGSNDSTDGPIIAVETMPQTQHFAADDEENDNEDELEVEEAIPVVRERTSDPSSTAPNQTMNEIGENEDAGKESNVHTPESAQANADEIQANHPSNAEIESNANDTSDRNAIMASLCNTEPRSRAAVADQTRRPSPSLHSNGRYDREDVRHDGNAVVERAEHVVVEESPAKLASSGVENNDSNGNEGDDGVAKVQQGAEPDSEVDCDSTRIITEEENIVASEIQANRAQTKRTKESAKPLIPRGTGRVSPKNVIHSPRCAEDLSRASKPVNQGREAGMSPQTGNSNNERSDEFQMEYESPPAHLQRGFSKDAVPVSAVKPPLAPAVARRLFDGVQPERTSPDRKRKGTNSDDALGNSGSESNTIKRRKKNASDEPVSAKLQQIGRSTSSTDVERVEKPGDDSIAARPQETASASRRGRKRKHSKPSRLQSPNSHKMKKKKPSNAKCLTSNTRTDAQNVSPVVDVQKHSTPRINQKEEEEIYRARLNEEMEQIRRFRVRRREMPVSLYHFVWHNDSLYPSVPPQAQQTPQAPQAPQSKPLTGSHRKQRRVLDVPESAPM